MSKGRPLIGGIKLPYQHVEKMKEAVKKWQRVGNPKPQTPNPRETPDSNFSAEPTNPIAG
jgi:hypothetical protein